LQLERDVGTPISFNGIFCRQNGGMVKKKILEPSRIVTAPHGAQSGEGGEEKPLEQREANQNGKDPDGGKTRLGNVRATTDSEAKPPAPVRPKSEENEKAW